MAIPLRLDALPVEVVLDICQTGILDARDLSGLMGTSAFFCNAIRSNTPILNRTLCHRITPERPSIPKTSCSSASPPPSNQQALPKRIISSDTGRKQIPITSLAYANEQAGRPKITSSIIDNPKILCACACEFLFLGAINGQMPSCHGCRNKVLLPVKEAVLRVFWALGDCFVSGGEQESRKTRQQPEQCGECGGNSIDECSEEMDDRVRILRSVPIEDLACTFLGSFMVGQALWYKDSARRRGLVADFEWGAPGTLSKELPTSSWKQESSSSAESSSTRGTTSTTSTTQSTTSPSPSTYSTTSTPQAQPEPQTRAEFEAALDAQEGNQNERMCAFRELALRHGPWLLDEYFNNTNNQSAIIFQWIIDEVKRIQAWENRSEEIISANNLQNANNDTHEANSINASSKQKNNSPSFNLQIRDVLAQRLGVDRDDVWQDVGRIVTQVIEDYKKLEVERVEKALALAAVAETVPVVPASASAPVSASDDDDEAVTSSSDDSPASDNAAAAAAVVDQNTGGAPSTVTEASVEDNPQFTVQMTGYGWSITRRW